MALSLSEVQAVTTDFVEKQPQDIYFTDNVLLYKLMAGGGMVENFVTPAELTPGGDKIRVILEYSNANTGGYGNTTKINQSKKVIANAARFRWGGYYASNTIDLLDQVKVNGDPALVDLVQMKLKNIQKTIRDTMGSRIYLAASASSGSASVDFIGLAQLFSGTSTTAYGSIQESDIALWAPNNSASASVAMNFKLLQSMRRAPAIGQNSSKKPNLYITTDVLKDSFERSLQIQARYKDVDLVNAGFDNVLFGGAPVVSDEGNQAAGYCDGLNLNFLKIKTHKDYAFTKPKWEYDKEQPDAMTANVRWIGQLVTGHRKAHVRRTGLVELT